MTPQEAFDIVAKHLFAQGRRSVGGSACMYRGDGGLKCAIGALIPDEQYSEAMEGCSASQMVAEAAVPALQGLSAGYLDALQQAHDRRVNWSGDGIALKAALLSVAREFDVDPAILDSLSFNRTP